MQPRLLEVETTVDNLVGGADILDATGLSDLGVDERQVQADLEYFKEHDPASAAYSHSQILQVRRGMQAVVAHRILSAFLDEAEATPSVLFEAERLAVRIQRATGVEIHPQARLGTTAIDHGHGTVIGQTVEAGNELFCYHGVTLGATGVKNISGRRHPKLGTKAFLGNNSQVLGPSLLGDEIKIGAGAKVINSVLARNVSIAAGVILRSVEVPSDTQVLATQNGEYLTRTKQADEKWTRLQRVDISQLED